MSDTPATPVPETLCGSRRRVKTADAATSRSPRRSPRRGKSPRASTGKKRRGTVYVKKEESDTEEETKDQIIELMQQQIDNLGESLVYEQTLVDEFKGDMDEKNREIRVLKRLLREKETKKDGAAATMAPKMLIWICAVPLAIVVAIVVGGLSQSENTHFY